jgi:hypothetical protein
VNVDDWITEAVASTTHGASLREVQRYIDEHHHEELSVKVLGDALDKLVQGGRLEVDNERYFAVKRPTERTPLKNSLASSPDSCSQSRPRDRRAGRDTA